MRAGRLRHRVELQRLVEDRNELNEVVQTWQTLDTVWARIEPLQGREFVEAQRNEARLSHRITIRAYTGLTVRDQVKYGTRTFGIVSVGDVEEVGREMRLMCLEDV